MSGKWTHLSIRLHKILEESSGKVKTMLPKHHHMKGTVAERILGATLLQKRLWSFKGEDLARGLALGMFIAFTPTIGIQMTLVCITIPFYPGNLPIALAATWLTNPLTAAPVYGAEWWVGKIILGLFGYEAGLPPSFFEYDSFWDIVQNIIRQGGTLWFGSIISSVFMAAASYWGVMWLTYLERFLRRIKLDHHRKIQREDRKQRREAAGAEERPGEEERKAPQLAQQGINGDGQE